MIIKTLKINLKITFIILIIFILLFSLIISFVFANNENEEKKDFIKWVDFKITYDVLDKTSKLDINSHVKNEEIKYNWIELLAYLACKNGGDFKKFKQTDLDDLIKKIKMAKQLKN